MLKISFPRGNVPLQLRQTKRVRDHFNWDGDSIRTKQGPCMGRNQDVDDSIKRIHAT